MNDVLIGLFVIIALLIGIALFERSKRETAENKAIVFDNKYYSIKQEKYALECEKAILESKLRTYEKAEQRECTALCTGCKHAVTDSYKVVWEHGARSWRNEFCKLNNPCKDAVYKEDRTK